MSKKVPIEVIDTKEGHAALVNQYWDSFARTAYQGYILGGRGAVTLNLDGLNELEPDAPAIESLMDYAVYAGFGLPSEEDEDIKRMFTEIGEQVDSYDPEEEIIVLVYGRTFEENSDFTIHRFAHGPFEAPPRVYKKYYPVH